MTDLLRSPTFMEDVLPHHIVRLKGEKMLHGWRCLAVFFLTTLFATTAAAQIPDTETTVVHNNGPIVTHPGEGPNGTDASALQIDSETRNWGLYRYGFDHTVGNATWIADDFTIDSIATEAWIETITFFAFEEPTPQYFLESGRIGSVQKSVLSLNLDILNGPPNETNDNVVASFPACLMSSSPSGIYRVPEDNLQETSREIMANVCRVEWTLGPGTYWLRWQTATDSQSMEAHSPQVTFLESPGASNANAMVYDGFYWTQARDGGDDVHQQDFPFVIEGAVVSDEFSAPDGTHVRNADGSEILFNCTDAIKPPLPPNQSLRPSWDPAYWPGEGPELVDGYRHQVFNGNSCTGTPMIDERWYAGGRVWGEAEIYSFDNGVYSFELLSPTIGPYCWRVRSWVRRNTTIFSRDWSDCCCMTVAAACTTLATPTITAIADTTCNGSTTNTTPELHWTNAVYGEGYRWQVRDAARKVVSSGITRGNDTYDTVDQLAPGSYTARVQARGDGQEYCDGAWSLDCSFTVEEGGAFSWWPEQPKQGERVRFADLSSGEPMSWYWDFDDGWTSTDQHPSHVFATASTYTVTRDVELETGHVIEQKTITVAGNVECGDTMCEGQETAWSCPADCALPPDQTGRAGGSDRRPTVPAAAGGLRGANGTTWYTEGWVHNPGEEPARFILEYTPRNKTSILQAGPFDLEPGHTIYWDNIVEDLFHSTGSGALWIDSTVPVIFLTRTYTLDPGNLSKSSGGTFGAAQMATRERLTVGRGEGKLYLIGLREDGEFRSNLHFQNIDKELEITVEVEVFDNTGTLLSRQTFPINGHSLRQKGLGQHFGISGVASAYATLEVIEGGGRLNSWASVIDNITGDFTFTDAVHSNQVAGKVVSEQHYLVAAVAHTTGVLNSVWRSGLDIFNEPTFPSQTVTLRFVAEYDRTGAVGEFLEKTVTVPSGEQLSWDDVLVDLFGVPENTKTQGALHIFSQDKLVVNSHTHNKRSDGGSLGMGLPGLTSGDLISADGRAGIMPGLTNSGDTRTNVGLAEYSGKDTQVSILFYSTDQENQLLNRNDPVKRNVPADEHLQLLNIFEQVEDLREITVEKIKAEVWVEGGGSIYSYATTIDNETGDPTAFTAAEE